MVNKFEEKLNKILKNEPDFLDQEGDILTNTIIDKAYKADSKLIELLISDKEIKDKFFKKIKDVYVFNINDFVSYIQDKNFLNDSYTKFKNKIGLNIGGKFLNERKEVSLVWPFKDCVLEGGMTKEDEKRKEIFFNEILAQDDIDKLLAPKVLTNWKRYTKNGEEKVKELKRDKDGVIRENLIIKGNNLLALHSLKEQFAGQVKLIYTDPPYNTGGSTETFTYNNNFKHSSWLTFMKNRLEIALNLLKEDGFIALTIDHEELYYIGVLMDEIFGRENRVGLVTIYINPKGRQHEKFFSAATEYMLVYAKNISVAKFNKVTLDEAIAETFNLTDNQGDYRLEPLIRVRTSTSRESKPDFYYPIYVSKDLRDITLENKKDYYEVFPKKNGKDFTWKTISETFAKRNANEFFVAKKEDNEIKIYHKYYEQQVLKNLWTDKKYFPEFQGTNLLKKILGENLFSYPKSLYAVLDTLKLMTSDEDLILDFFAGSGTTGHATIELNKEDGGDRKFILVEQLNTHMDVDIKRIRTVSNKEDFIYCELMKYNEQFMEDIEKAKDIKVLLKIWREMKDKAFFEYSVDLKVFEENIKEFEKLSLIKQKDILISLLNKNQLYVNLSDIEDNVFKVQKEDKELNKEFYQS